ncbi:MAG: DUF1080 domain-containing protein [Planctomycetes bacterium]|nr:DUF1080 domain-containing protein [Planctomycetota bacterium]
MTRSFSAGRLGATRTAFSAVAFALLIPAAGLSAQADDDSTVAGHRSSDDLKRQGFQPLFDGKSLNGWDVQAWHEGHWVARDGVIDYDGGVKRKRGQDPSLWTSGEFGDFVLYVEWRLSAEPEMKPQPIVLYNGDFLRDEDGNRITRPRLDAGDSGILMRGILKCQANIWSQELGSGEINGYRTDRSMPQEVRRACIPIRNADRPFGEWNAFEITLKGECMTVVVNGQQVISAARLPDLPAKGPIGLQHHGDSVQFRNLWIKELD